MSRLAREEFEKARNRQAAQSDARRIRERVDATQQTPARAGIRWPFELIQNAHDAGPREGYKRMEVHFNLCDDRLVVTHTGKPFLALELSALLNGGSSKELDSEKTTGRFGTGFLVTHAVSTQVDVAGVLTTQGNSEAFDIRLSRDGDVNSIVTNIELASKSLENAAAVDSAWLSANPTASFTYHNPNGDIVRPGLDRLEQTLPYLYATCGKLGRVQIDRFGERICFEPRNVTRNQDTFVVKETPVSIQTPNGTNYVTAVRIGRKEGQSALLVVLEYCEPNVQKVLCPRKGFARVFVTFPIAGTDYLPFNVVLDGRFAPAQERDSIAMHDDDRALIDEALSAFPALVQHAVKTGWHDAHKLANLSVPSRALSGDESDELQWWKDTVARVAKETASKPIVQTETGLLPALRDGNGRAVTFLMPAIRARAPQSIDYDAFHEVASAVTELTLPDKEIAESWAEIARQWDDVGVTVERLGLKELTDWLKAKGNSVSELPIDGDRFLWLAQLFRLASEMNDQNVRGMVNGLFPNQHALFVDTTEDYLYRDGGIPKEIKDIAFEIDEDLRSQLLHPAMADALKLPDYRPANDLASELLGSLDGGGYTEAKATDTVIESLAKQLPDDSPFDEDTGLAALRASARLAAYLAENGDVQRVRRCPLLTAAESIVHLSGRQQILAPAMHWPISAQPYVGLYTESRLLSERYSLDEVIAGALDKLIGVGLVIAAPLFEGRRAELADANLLHEMSTGEEDTVGVIVRDACFGQIAFLATDLVQRCGQDPELAKLLLRFVLEVAAREDHNWRKSESVPGVRSGERVDLTLRRATWPFELKVRSWIPVRPPDADRIVPMPADESNLRSILNLSWLSGNRDAVNLLRQVFGFRQLTLMLDSLDTETESDLVKLLQDPELVRVAAGSPEAVKFASDLGARDISLDSVRELVQDLEEDEKLPEHLANRREQRRRVQENQNLGAIVETLVKENLERAGFSVCDTGVGSDFEIAADLGDLANLELTRGTETWLVEVKATRDQSVRMTVTQAKTAVEKGDGFLLCVVPVGTDETDLEKDNIRANMRFVQDIGPRVKPLCEKLNTFENLQENITQGNTDIQLEMGSGTARIRVYDTVWRDEICLKDLSKRLK